jgi:hypothetical protein
MSKFEIRFSCASLRAGNTSAYSKHGTVRYDAVQNADKDAEQ